MYNLKGNSNLTLNDGGKIAVLGGGPAGSFFSIFALKLAKQIGKDIDLTIYEHKSFLNEGPSSCNMCAGVISESLVQLLAIEGICLKPPIVQRAIDTYCFQTISGDVLLNSPSLQRGIATVYRGGGPTSKSTSETNKKPESEKISFDDFLIDCAKKEGAKVENIKIDKVELNKDKPGIFSKGEKLFDADLVVGACGINAKTAKMFEELGIGYTHPSVIKAFQSEIHIGKSFVSSHFGNAIHIFLINQPDVKFAAITPKGSYVTVSMLGKDITKQTVIDFLNYPVVKDKFPDSWDIPDAFCRCVPKINVGAARHPFADRIVMIGDASSARLYKDGIGSAYLTAKAAANTAILYGVSEAEFYKYYYPTCRKINRDNFLGNLMFAFTDTINKTPIIREALLKLLRNEQKRPELGYKCSTILWDMFTGNERYTDIFIRAFNPGLLLRFLINIFNVIFIRFKTIWRQ
ncbi:MAG: putative geranylgeranyl reductase [Candidatus Scalindua rubra]|uniref:Putative geranylgeranyl reductase n=1 Tax=Candidatus Scalindua rubra TaxID=1872076 RepID=A0A1E3X5L4_9BACT|nr:MAG: putative geranylgeranyl reductase [Candidatus Scalindua rubra]